MAWQARDYLARWLSPRGEDMGKEATRLKGLAERLGVDWRHPPEPMTFDERLAILSHRPTPAKRGRRKGAAA
jgi:hypothetical protein